MLVDMVVDMLVDVVVDMVVGGAWWWFVMYGARLLGWYLAGSCGGWIRPKQKQLKGEPFFFEIVFVCVGSIIPLPAVPAARIKRIWVPLAIQRFSRSEAWQSHECSYLCNFGCHHFAEFFLCISLFLLSISLPNGPLATLWLLSWTWFQQNKPPMLTALTWDT